MDIDYFLKIALLIFFIFIFFKMVLDNFFSKESQDTKKVEDSVKEWLSKDIMKDEIIKDSKGKVLGKLILQGDWGVLYSKEGIEVSTYSRDLYDLCEDGWAFYNPSDFVYELEDYYKAKHKDNINKLRFGLKG